MSTGQTILTICALVILTSILLNFYTTVASTGDSIGSGQDGILATTLTTSLTELAQGCAFDEVTDSSDIALQNPSALSLHLGRDPGEDSLSIYECNDFDDFNDFEIEQTVMGSSRRYRSRFSVYYVNPTNLELRSNSPTFVKRMDIKTWRVFPPATDANQIDTLRSSLVMGYFHFD
jgi:hypothetical protein